MSIDNMLGIIITALGYGRQIGTPNLAATNSKRSATATQRRGSYHALIAQSVTTSRSEGSQPAVTRPRARCETRTCRSIARNERSNTQHGIRMS